MAQTPTKREAREWITTIEKLGSRSLTREERMRYRGLIEYLENHDLTVVCWQRLQERLDPERYHDRDVSDWHGPMIAEEEEDEDAHALLTA
jgi:hypothetical protein